MKILLQRVKLSLFSMLALITGSNRMRRHKLLSGVALLWSVSALLSCNTRGKGEVTCYKTSVDTTRKDSIEMKTCYEAVDTSSYQVPPKQLSDSVSTLPNQDPIMPTCYAPPYIPDSE